MDVFAAPKSNQTRPDVCGYLFQVCKRLQRDALDRRGITCLFDVDSGALAAWRCEAIGWIVESVVAKICQAGTLRAQHGKITVSLHRSGHIWALGVTDQGVRACAANMMTAPMPAVDELVTALGGMSRTRFTRFGATLAVVFVERPRWWGTGETATPMESMFLYPDEISALPPRFRIAESFKPVMH